jgi:hypothetical protein
MSATPETGHFPNRFYGDQQGELHTNGSRLYLDSVSDGLTALAGGGQAGATALPGQINRVTTVATAADSAQLPASAAGVWLVCINTTANSMNVFPAAGDAINALAANTALAVAAGKTTIFFCAAAGHWYSVLTA